METSFAVDMSYAGETMDAVHRGSNSTNFWLVTLPSEETPASHAKWNLEASHMKWIISYWVPRNQ